MTESSSGTAAVRKAGASRPVRVSDLNRRRVQTVAEGIKQARGRGGDEPKPRKSALARKPQFDAGDSRPPRRNADDAPARPRRFGDEERPKRRYGDDVAGARRSTDNAGARPRRFGDDTAAKSRRFGDGTAAKPRRFGDDNRSAPRRFGDDTNAKPRRFADDASPRGRRPGTDERRPPGDRPARSRRNEGEARPARSSFAGEDARARKAGGPSHTAMPPTRSPRAATPASAPRPDTAGTDHDGLVRLSKRMSELGLCSRREADEWIPRGWVLVDGKPVTELGTRVRPDAEIEIHQAARSVQGERVTVLLHKPIGYVSGQAEDGYQPAAALFTADNQWEGDPTRKRFAPWQHKGLAPAGRLDIDSTGLLVLTQDGRIARQLIGEDSTIEKEYLVRVVWEDAPDGPVERNVSAVFPAERLDKLRHGLSLDGQPLKPAKVSWQNEEQLRFVLREGKKRQIRRMCEQVGLKVVGLKRVRMGRIVLGDLPVGQWRFLAAYEKF
ncbi:23S rRNA pseudouridine2604 synthase [Cupriavidus gilardii J11]|uniref:Dual-specificity RNA pseudouridine synthase RluF n=1 Tax=Cupriavidus gilardii J11 TaxID=936133 RepID=A0A562B3X0_9BURK|nr:23S rRNA pseudouridine2604 synthase [Cupriavidus gilardii J11]